MSSGSADVDVSFFRSTVEQLRPYQPGTPIEEVQRELGIERVVKLASNEGPFGPFPVAQEAMVRSAAELNRYPDGGSYRLHEALAARHGVEAAAICVGAGADGCIDLLSQATIDPGDEVVCGWPSFPSYVIYARKLGGEVRMVPLAEQRYDLDGLLGAITARTKLVYICHPNNPTGTMNTTDELDAYFARVPEHVLTVVDQAYFEYIDLPDYPDAVERYLKRGARVAVLRTFSKIYGLAGLRIGYAVFLDRGLRRDGQGAPTVRHRRAGAGSGDRQYRRGRRARSAASRPTRSVSSALEEVLRGHALELIPSVGNFVYAETGGDGADLYERLLREGIVVRPLQGFGAPTAIRVTVGTPEELDLLDHALARVLARA